ncbi:IclR family transcriptional regulator [Desulfosarcina widdelii]|uniref:IclR family transcriptional regulator n=1 Tax=Desulfosarcina widdelii TaxID=947919 RepID=A0A5K7YZ31_9BACT|nr:IclR family transcriptional regulator C-terminal domain-containing protein [Desulfosarcina widdelii]BBO74656.1 IclR family transcriptional regulator [Desulfosarcina widdelii]
MSKGKYYFSKSLEKGLKILSLFDGETPVLTQSEIAKTLGLNMTSTYRYINTLEELGYLEKDAKTKEIRPTVLCLLLCNNLMRATDRMRLIQTVVDRVHGENNISIDVALVVDDTLRRLYHREAEETLTYSLPDNSQNCLHNTALGKAYLCCLPEDEMQDRVDKLVLTAKTEKTITTKKRLLSELRAARQRGYATSDEEYLSGLLAIGAPLIDPISKSAVGAVSFDFSVLQHRADEIVIRYADQIVQTAKLLSELLPAQKNGRTIAGLTIAD